MNLVLYQLLMESSHVRIADAFVELFDNSTADSVVICTKAIAVLSKEIIAAEKIKDPDKKLVEYKKILGHAKRLHTEASKIPADKWTDHLIRAMTTNMGTILNYVKAAVVDRDLKNMTRNDTLENLDAIIKTLEARIEHLEKKTN